MLWALLPTLGWGAPEAVQSWPDVVRALTSPYALHRTVDSLNGPLADLCEGGLEAACELPDGALGAVLEAACTSGDDVACLGAAWQGWGGDPPRTVRRLQRLCDAEVQDACASLAEARFLGRGTWRSRRLGTMDAERLCDAGVGAACLVMADILGTSHPTRQRSYLERAAVAGAWSEGRRAALMDAGPERTQALLAACEAADARACLLAAAEASPDEAQGLAARSCRLGEGEGCLADVVLRVRAGTRTVAEAVQELDAHCALGEELSCHGAAAYRNGGRPLAFSVGSLPEIRGPEILDAHLVELGACYREHVERGGRGPLHLPLTVDFDADGVILAVVTGLSDADTEQCVADALQGYDSLGPTGGPVRAPLRTTLLHRARPIPIDGASDLDARGARDALVASIATTVDHALNVCWIGLGGSLFDEQFTLLRGTVSTDGVYRLEELLESSGDASTDACVRGLLDGWTSPGPRPEYPVPFDLRLDFNEVVRVDDGSLAVRLRYAEGVADGGAPQRR